jgi:hypothetical protein
MSTSPVVYLSAKSGRYHDFGGGGLVTDANRRVWAVAFKGTFHSSGGPPGSSRLPDHHSVIVIIDFRTGEFIQASVPAPYVPD